LCRTAGDAGFVDTDGYIHIMARTEYVVAPTFVARL
jgi:acyl-coenzyme A synthetase/AMP-(fatty) acid ligase